LSLMVRGAVGLKTKSGQRRSGVKGAVEIKGAVGMMSASARIEFSRKFKAAFLGS